MYQLRLGLNHLTATEKSGLQAFAAELDGVAATTLFEAEMILLLEESEELGTIKLDSPENAIILQELEAYAQRHCLAIEPFAAVPEKLEEKDWQTAWQAFWKPEKILHNLIIAPSWADEDPIEALKIPQADPLGKNLAPEDASEVFLLRLDPGMAFGTGAHETTRLMLVLMHEYLFVRVSKRVYHRVLDVGCGSGILALYAAMGGKCQEVIGLDTDSVAVEISEQNAALNHLPCAEKKLFFTCQTLQAYLNTQSENQFHLVLANILLPVILETLDAIIEALLPEGIAILGGILIEQFDELYAVLKTRAPTIQVLQMVQGTQWVCVVIQKVAA